MAMTRWKTLDAFKRELRRDPRFRKRLDALEPEYLVAREIIAARRAADMSQEELAKAIGTSQSRISKWERGEEMPRIHALFRIADATGTKLRVTLDRRKASA